MLGGQQTDFHLELRLAGRVRLLRADGVEITPRGRKAQGLLTLLGTAAECRRSRAALQDKLWSNRGPDHGAASLRQELAGIRRALGDWSGCLLSEAGWVGLDTARVRVRLDPDPSECELNGDPPEFASGLDIADPEFEDWIRDQRAYHAERFREAVAAATTAPARTVMVVQAAPGAPAVDPEQQQPSVALLPLTLLSELAEGPLVAFGLATDVIGLLSRYRRLDVIAYASTAALDARLPARLQGAQLGARYLARGTLWLDRTRMRLSIDLILAETERLVWSHTFNCPCDDLFEVEREMASSVAAAVMVEIDQIERTRVRARDPNSLAPYALWLRGLDDMLSLDPARCNDALRYFFRAAALDHGYARAFSGISRAHGFRWMYRWAEQREEALAEAENFALQAVDVDANDPGATSALGWVALYQRNHDRALEAYRHALDLNPSDADIIFEYADAINHGGAPEVAIPMFERAVRLNPFSSDRYLRGLVYAHYLAEDYESAIRTVNRMRHRNTILRTLAASQAMLGLGDEARSSVRLLHEVGHGPMLPAEEWVTMVPDRNPRHTALLLEGMKRAGL